MPLSSIFGAVSSLQEGTSAPSEHLTTNLTTNPTTNLASTTGL